MSWLRAVLVAGGAGIMAFCGWILYWLITEGWSSAVQESWGSLFFILILLIIFGSSLAGGFIAGLYAVLRGIVDEDL